MERGVRDRLTIITFDAQAAALNHMAEGKIDAMVVQNPFDMGIQTVRLLRAMLASDEAAELARKKDYSAAEASPENSSSSSDEEDDDVSV